MAKRSRSGRADAQRNRERLLRSAREVLAERGLDVEIEEIAKRAKFGVGTIYRNYPSKEDLILEVAREMAVKTSTELLAIAATVQDARECVAQVMRIGFKRVEEYGRLTMDLVAGTAPPPYDVVVNREGLSHFYKLLLQREVDQGHFRPDLDLDYCVAVWFALVVPAVLLQLMAHRSLGEIEALATEFFLRAISVPSREAGESAAPKRD